MKTDLLYNGKNKRVSTLNARNHLVFHRTSRKGIFNRMVSQETMLEYAMAVKI